MDIQKSRVSNPPDTGLYHWVHRVLLMCKYQRLLRLLLGTTFAFENFYANKLRPRLGLRYSEKYLAYSWILSSPLLSPGKYILDIGCGDSLFPSKLASLGYQSYAVDLSRSGCIAASDSRVNFMQSDACHMQFQPGQFDAITAISTLEHIDRHCSPSARILEIGCNVGRNLNYLFLAGFQNLEGIEISEEAVQLLKETYPEMAQYAKIYNNPVEDIVQSFKNDAFDLVFTMAVLEHIHQDSEWLFPEMARIAKTTLITIEAETSVSWGISPATTEKYLNRLARSKLRALVLVK